MKKYLLILIFFTISAMQMWAGDPTIDDIVWSKDCGTNVPQVKFSPDGNLIYAALNSSKPLSLTTATSATVKQFEGLNSSSVIDLSADGKTFCAIKNDSLVVWNTQTGAILEKIGPPAETWIKPYSDNSRPGFIAMAINPDGNSLAFTISFVSSVTSHGDLVHSTRLFILDTHTWQIINRIDVEAFTKIIYSHNGNYLACGANIPHNNPSEIQIFDTKTWQLYTTYNGHTYPISDLSFSPDDSFLSSGALDGNLNIWDIKTKKLFKNLSNLPDIFSVNLFSNTTVIYCDADSNTNGIWLNILDINTLKIKYRIKSNLVSSICTFENKYILTAQESYIILLDENKYLTYVDEEPNNDNKIEFIPNPLNSFASVIYTNTKNSNVAIDIFDDNSREIDNIYRGYLESGKHTLPWNPKNLPDGVYFCRILTKDDCKLIKVVICR
jgi:WD40 repeat protein